MGGSVESLRNASTDASGRPLIEINVNNANRFASRLECNRASLSHALKTHKQSHVVCLGQIKSQTLHVCTFDAKIRKIDHTGRTHARAQANCQSGSARNSKAKRSHDAQKKKKTRTIPKRNDLTIEINHKSKSALRKRMTDAAHAHARVDTSIVT